MMARGNNIKKIYVFLAFLGALPVWFRICLGLKSVKDVIYTH